MGKQLILHCMKRSIWHQDYVTLRSALKEMQLQQNLIQAQLPNKLKKPQSFLAKYECGDRNLDFIEVLNVCDGCHSSVLSLIKRLSK